MCQSLISNNYAYLLCPCLHSLVFKNTGSSGNSTPKQSGATIDQVILIVRKKIFDGEEEVALEAQRKSALRAVQQQKTYTPRPRQAFSETKTYSGFHLAFLLRHVFCASDWFSPESLSVRKSSSSGSGSSPSNTPSQRDQHASRIAAAIMRSGTSKPPKGGPVVDAGAGVKL